MKNKICIYVQDYTSMGGSERSIRDFYYTLLDHCSNNYDLSFRNKEIYLTTSLADATMFRPHLIITQQAAVQSAIQLAIDVDAIVWVFIHGAKQTFYHERIDTFVFNSYSLMEADAHSLDLTPPIKRCFLQPIIDFTQFKIINKIKTFTFIGSKYYNYLKGGDLVVELAKIMPDFQFIYVGPVYTIDYTKKYPVIGIIPPVTNNQRIIFIPEEELPTNVNQINNIEDLSKIYQQTDLLIIPSLVESFGRVAVEASIFNIPIVASDLPGIREATSNLSTYVRNYRDVMDWKQAITKVLNTPKSIVDRYKALQSECLQDIYKRLEDSLM